MSTIVLPSPRRGVDVLEKSVDPTVAPASYRAAQAIMALLFAAGAYVQLNDPDPEIWGTAYALPSLVCAFEAVGEQFPLPMLPMSLPLPFLLLLKTATVAAKAVFGQGKDIMMVEEGREALGMFFVLSWLGFTAWWGSTGGLSVNATRVGLAILTVYVAAWAAWVYALQSPAIRNQLEPHCTGLLGPAN